MIVEVYWARPECYYAKMLVANMPRRVKYTNICAIGYLWQQKRKVNLEISQIGTF